MVSPQEGTHSHGPGWKQGWNGNFDKFTIIFTSLPTHLCTMLICTSREHCPHTIMIPIIAAPSPPRLLSSSHLIGPCVPPVHCPSFGAMSPPSGPGTL